MKPYQFYQLLKNVLFQINNSWVRGWYVSDIVSRAIALFSQEIELKALLVVNILILYWQAKAAVINLNI